MTATIGNEINSVLPGLRVAITVRKFTKVHLYSRLLTGHGKNLDLELNVS